MTATMKAVVVRAHGGPEQLVFEERPIPQPGPGELRVRVAACGLNHLDLWLRRGVPGHSYPLPLIPGCDFAGVVDALGPGLSAWKGGQRVAGLPGLSCGACAACASGQDQLCRQYGILGEHRDGACAQYVVVPARNLIPLFDGIDFVQAAAVPLVFLTAWSMLVNRARIQPGETVLVQAALSGVGSAAVQIAKLWGLRVIATAGSDAKLARARELGADEVIHYGRENVPERIKALTGGRGVEVVVEHVGADTFFDSLRCLAWAGRLVTCGATTGTAARIDLAHVFFKSLSILGSTMGPRGDLYRIWKLVERGLLKPVVGRVLPLEQVAEAHALLERREVAGKVVLTVE